MRFFWLILCGFFVFTLPLRPVEAQTPPPPTSAATPTVDFATVGQEDEPEHGGDEADGLANPIPEAPTAPPEARTTSLPTPVVVTPYEAQVRLQGALLVLSVALVLALGGGLLFWVRQRRPKA